ncbi:hypothetical protein CABS01_11757 [Colletotrichum abscissum]|uniref:Uncharacterized protein n=1 Tax=Colletotrichum abscissum TaxID=1671311 RepID=A0A9P9XDP6_9PEZI|nr:uncharacterized protein CABS01_11757 [Colletotrichum abscissum]KAI3548660.1 hypothetical protein CABS02_08190 [Colletotrichum abscissum]KAK1492860.1 hypothetical protein CABS01_11757 [Colletotrichum abscissum]
MNKTCNNKASANSKSVVEKILVNAPENILYQILKQLELNSCRNSATFVVRTEVATIAWDIRPKFIYNPLNNSKYILPRTLSARVPVATGQSRDLRGRVFRDISMSIEKNKKSLMIKLAADLTPSLYQYAESREAQSLLKRSVELGNSPLSTKKYEANQSQRLRRQSSHPMNGDGSRTCYQQAMRLVKEGEDFLMESYFEIGDF